MTAGYSVALIKDSDGNQVELCQDHADRIVYCSINLLDSYLGIIVS